MADASAGARRPDQSHSRIPELDGIRALAIIAVLTVHLYANDLTLPALGTLHGLAKGAFVVAAHGWLGVDLFFVLSGFLITGILIDTRSNATYFRDFWLRRALRILPVLFTVVTILAFIYRPHWLYVLMAFFFAVDFAPLFGLGNRDMGPLWSLGVEEQFYLVWPFLVFLLRTRVLAFVTLGVIVVVPIVRACVSGDIELPWFRVDGLAVGALIAIFVRSRYFSRAMGLRCCAAALFVVALLVLADLVSRTTSYALRISEADLFFGVMVMGAVTLAGHPWLAPLRSPLARFIADTSFCVYLIHTPLLDFVRFAARGSHVANPFLAAAIQTAITVPLAFALAALSRKYLELPFLQLKDRWAPGKGTAQPGRAVTGLEAVPVRART